MTTASSLRGLTAAEVAERVARGQVNRVRRSDWAEYLDIVSRNVFTLLNALVVPAAIALFLLGQYRDGLAVSGMAITNTVLGLIQEIRAKWHLDRLTLLAEGRARMMRDGQVVEVASGDVVKDDVILVAAGDTIVADGTVMESRYLEVDEALLTGESDPVSRKPGDQVLSGSYAVAGEGAYRADRVGAESFAQKTTAEARSYRYTASPMQDIINRIIRILTVVAVVLCALYLLLHYLVGRFDWTELVQNIAATITLMIPQGLVLMATLAFILGAVRLSARGALVQRLNAVEAMASIDTLCMDKTGTLTTNELQFQRLVVVTRDLDESAVGHRLVLFASLSLDKNSKNLVAVRKALGEVPGELLDQLPFKSQNRYSAVKVRTPQGEEVILALGASEALQPFLDSSDWEGAWKDLLRTGLRILLFADLSPGHAPPRPTFDGSLEGFRLRPLALVALSDQLRPQAPTVLKHLAHQGIDFKIISGDNPETVRATVAPLAQIADEPALQRLATDPVVTGADLTASPNPADLILKHHVFGRVNPWQKVEIVTTLKAHGSRVAMIGDGVNDVLPIKNANLGIAMGDGARASKTVAGLVLQTNDFGLLPEALDEGRTIVRNIRRAAKLFLTKNVYVPVLVLGTVLLFNLPFPLLPRQVTLLNFLTIGLPALLITLGRERASAVRRDFLRDVGAFTVRTGVVIGVAGLATMVLARQWGQDEKTQRTLLLAVLVLLGITTILRAIRNGETESLPSDRLYYALGAATFVGFILSLYLPLTNWFFELTPLDVHQWLFVSTVIAPSVVVLLLSDWLVNKTRLDEPQEKTLTAPEGPVRSV